MNIHSKYILLLAALCCLATSVSGKELIREFRGYKSADTAEFEVEAPWILDWRVNSEFSTALAMDVSLVEAGTGVHVGNVLKTKWTGNGVRLFNESGRYRFKVISTLANWTLRVEELTREEAKLYSPKAND